MVATRSSSKATSIHPDAKETGNKASKATSQSSKKASKANSQSSKSTVKKTPTHTDTKRKRGSAEAQETPSKRAKKEQLSDEEPAPQSDKIMINRAPVLELWGASVAHFTYPDLPWETCVSIGSAISSICAVAKGRSIGTVSEKTEPEQRHKKHKDLEVEVMHFKLKLKDGLAVVGSEQKGKPANEEYLKKKFSDDSYHTVTRTFEQGLENWKGEEAGLNKKAFHFYEQFRPSVSPGQKGWGRKGELDLKKVQTVLQK